MRARLTYNTIHDGADYETAMRSMEVDARRAVDLDRQRWWCVLGDRGGEQVALAFERGRQHLLEARDRVDRLDQAVHAGGADPLDRVGHHEKRTDNEKESRDRSAPCAGSYKRFGQNNKV